MILDQVINPQCELGIHAKLHLEIEKQNKYVLTSNMEEKRDTNMRGLECMVKHERGEKKASEKHKQLANFIKETHNHLRSESEIHGPEEAWKMHVAQGEKLKVIKVC